LKPVLDEVQPPLLTEKVPAAAVHESPFGNGSDNGMWFEQSGDVTSLVVPLRIPVPMLRKNGHLPPEAKPVEPVTPPIAGPANVARIGLLTGRPLEAVNIDQTTLGSRPGYKP